MQKKQSWAACNKKTENKKQKQIRRMRSESEIK